VGGRRIDTGPISAPPLVIPASIIQPVREPLQPPFYPIWTCPCGDIDTKVDLGGRWSVSGWGNDDTVRKGDLSSFGVCAFTCLMMMMCVCVGGRFKCTLLSLLVIFEGLLGWGLIEFDLIPLLLWGV
jgi:hypothetical protein